MNTIRRNRAQTVRRNSTQTVRRNRTQTVRRNRTQPFRLNRPHSGGRGRRRSSLTPRAQPRRHALLLSNADTCFFSLSPPRAAMGTRGVDVACAGRQAGGQGRSWATRNPAPRRRTKKRRCRRTTKMDAGRTHHLLKVEVIRDRAREAPDHDRVARVTQRLLAARPVGPIVHHDERLAVVEQPRRVRVVERVLCEVERGRRRDREGQAG